MSKQELYFQGLHSKWKSNKMILCLGKKNICPDLPSKGITIT